MEYRRKHRLITAGVVTALSVLCATIALGDQQPSRPNIIYIALEDITPMMGCYGDNYARTPNFDKLAAEGIRYTRAYSVGPVCSVSRSSIVSGMYPTSLGTMHHRSQVGRGPAFLEMIPNLMGKAGYYTTNNKTDYNIQGAQWHKSRAKDVQGWRHRPDQSQPFFCKFDFGECHSSITKIPEADIVEESELHRRAKGKPLWEVGQQLDDYERILETANLQLQGHAAEELIARSKDSDPLVRYWAVLGLAVVTQTAGPETVEAILPSLEGALNDAFVDVRLIASEGLFNLGHYEEALPVLVRAMKHPSELVQARVGNILDSQPPDANEHLQPAVEPLAAALKRSKPRGRYRGAFHPFDRAYKAITGQELYYRWGMGASGSPTNPLMEVQKTKFVPRSRAATKR